MNTYPVPVSGRFRRQSSGKALWLSAVMLVATTLASAAHAHDFWIEPETFHPHANERVPLKLFVGANLKGEAIVYVPDQFVRYVYVNGTGTYPIQGVLGDDPAGSVVLRGPGPHVVGYQSKKFDVTFEDFDKFESYLRTEGLEDYITKAKELMARRGRIVETYSRCAKSLIGDTGDPRDIVLGCPIELVAEERTNTDKHRLHVRLLYDGDPLEGALVVAFNKRNPQVKQSVRSDKNGHAEFNVDTPGVWLIKSVHMTSTGFFSSADLESYWASLSFEQH